MVTRDEARQVSRNRKMIAVGLGEGERARAKRREGRECGLDEIQVGTEEVREVSLVSVRSKDDGCGTRSEEPRGVAAANDETRRGDARGNQKTQRSQRDGVRQSRTRPASSAVTRAGQGRSELSRSGQGGAVRRRHEQMRQTAARVVDYDDDRGDMTVMNAVEMAGVGP
ncbi:hypothetical protein K461DRAFT_81465 [Myriangium duriaei CBS 260.36]|uniref:Uncharacterized protein n=1 Tax=Myriangium duriaei CBS 260.36 TaxID=1168546 RepID=A0A9P4MJX8_9PEZI|nr:hypothetical protein K461DRAFT_81465 [Myriangium duriaei CBS 260.36]